MENKKLSVEAIENGTVIDHIPAGLGLAILRQFKLLHYGSAVTVGFNLPSKTQGSKDIIKISGVAFDDAAANPPAPPAGPPVGRHRGQGLRPPPDRHRRRPHPRHRRCVRRSQHS